jgi:hypothetical protein
VIGVADKSDDCGCGIQVSHVGECGYPCFAQSVLSAVDCKHSQYQSYSSVVGWFEFFDTAVDAEP